MGRVLGVWVWGNKCKPKPSPTSGTGWDGQEGMEQEDEKAGAEQEQRLVGISSQAAKQFFRGPVLRNEKARTQASRE